MVRHQTELIDRYIVAVRVQTQPAIADLLSDRRGQDDPLLTQQMAKQRPAVFSADGDMIIIAPFGVETPRFCGLVRFILHPGNPHFFLFPVLVHQGFPFMTIFAPAPASF